MSDSETRGWRNGGRACDYIKDIDGKRYEIHRAESLLWCVYLWGAVIAHDVVLDNAKRAAHAHARETK